MMVATGAAGHDGVSRCVNEAAAYLPLRWSDQTFLADLVQLRLQRCHRHRRGRLLSCSVDNPGVAGAE